MKKAAALIHQLGPQYVLVKGGHLSEKATDILYDGKNYTCVPGLNGEVGGNDEKVHAVMDGNIVTGISVGGAYQFALDLIKALVSDEKAAEIAASTCWVL